jgi:hypothetical protein
MREKLSEVCDELEYLSTLEGTEAGEYWASLANFARHVDDMSKSLAKAVEKEARSILAFIHSSAKVVEIERTATHTVTTLEWNNE